MTQEQTILHEPVVPDFMRWVLQHAPSAADGTVFLADKVETVSIGASKPVRVPSGQILLAVLFKASNLVSVSQAEARAQVNSLHMALTLGLLKPFLPYKAAIQWPDEIIIQHKKVAGVHLIRLADKNRTVAFIALITINLNNSFTPTNDLYHTSVALKDVIKETYDEKEFATKVVESLKEALSRWERRDHLQIFEDWRDAQAYVGDSITLHQRIGMVVRGVVKGFLSHGDMQLLDERDKMHTLGYYQVEDVSMQELHDRQQP